ncbi:pto-interacting protein 1-like [Salvia splendens]|uniref:pto-interacting protein 1-like n=1 Tax=Salvia splendens TaxID=180675 RepID=UPI001C274632|nr:pto-interacting protein 1-like [Salvia splendens]
MSMTANFSMPCGTYVFRGTLKTGPPVAIKRLGTNLPHQEFLTKVSTIFGLKHENVVKLLHYCADNDQHFLVYEFAQQGSLYNILYGGRGIEPEPRPALSWAQRIRIGVGAARGLRYLHEKNLMHYMIASDNVSVFDDVNRLLRTVSVHEIVDAKLKADYPPRAAERMAEIACSCLQFPSNLSPEMSEVLNSLEELLPLDSQS